MQDSEKILNAKQEKALAALLSQPTIREAAREAGVSDRSIFNWLNEPAFSQAYREARAKNVSLAVAGLQRSMGQALEALQDVMTNPDSPASARVSAARTVLELAIRGTELEDLAARVDALEREIIPKR